MSATILSATSSNPITSEDDPIATAANEGTDNNPTTTKIGENDAEDASSPA